MKGIVLFLLIFPLFTLGQNRFEKEFTRADSVFIEQTKKVASTAAMETDSIFASRSFYNCIYDASISSDKRKNIIISEDDYLNEFMNSYMLGQLSFYYNKDFNYDILERKIKKIKRELRKLKKFGI